MSAIRFSKSKSKMPRASKLISSISSYLFEEEFGECRFMKDTEKESLKKAIRALSRAQSRADKSK